MFPLAGKDYPQSGEDLAESIQEALSEVLTFPKKGNVVTFTGGSFPEFKSVKVDLSGASVSTDTPPPPPKPKGKRQPGPSAEKLSVVGKPVKYQGSEANVELSATGVRFDYAHDANSGNAMLVLADAESGHVVFSVDKDDLQKLLLAAASAGAKQQGVTIQDLQAKLTSRGPRTLDAEVRVKAKKMVMSGTVVLKGTVDIDDALVATVSNLAATGEGMMGNMAAGMLQGKLKEAEGKKIPLTTFSLGDLTLEDLKISTDKGLKITADVGKKSA